MISDANTDTSVGRSCRLLKPVRDREGRTRFNERPRILREIYNLGRRMYLVEFADHATTFLFPDEIIIE
ncbi:MAG: hypothetical protein ACREP6_12720 [Candidatus Binataceae bacterium]